MSDALSRFIGIFSFIAIAILILGLVRDWKGTTGVLDSLWSGLDRGYAREYQAGHFARYPGKGRGY